MEEYVCSQCGKPAYYDGRCGDGPILMCNCAKKGPYYYDGRCGDGPVSLSDAKPVKVGGWPDR